MAGKVITNRIGETNIAKNGLKMTIIAYRNCHDIDVKFEDGVIITHKTYDNFKKGDIKHPQIYAKSNEYKTNRIGETNIAKNGLKMTITAYHTNHNIDIEFEDGVTVTGKTYASFKKGEIGHPQISKNSIRKHTNHIGEINIAKNGLKMIIIAWRKGDDIDIKFEDSVIVTNKRYANFKEGRIKHPNITAIAKQSAKKHIGETNIMSNGLKATITTWRKSDDIDIKFEDNAIVTNKTYQNFKKGSIFHPSQINIDKTGETNIARKYGLKMIITTYHTNTNIDIQFEDGYIAKHKIYQSFQKGTIKHPFPYQMNDNITIEKRAYIHNNIGNFYCHCNKCGKQDIMTISEMKEHKCSA